MIGYICNSSLSKLDVKSAVRRYNGAICVYVTFMYCVRGINYGFQEFSNGISYTISFSLKKTTYEYHEI